MSTTRIGTGIIASAMVCCVSALELSELSWMGGCWMLDGKASGSGEMWTEPLGNMLLGIGFMSKQGNVSRYEYMRIEKRESGEIYFVAIPSGQQETEFRMTQHTEKRVVFENPAHDFPQRITYSQIAEGVMQAKAESKKDDSYKGFELTLLRTECQSPSP